MSVDMLGPLYDHFQYFSIMRLIWSSWLLVITKIIIFRPSFFSLQRSSHSKKMVINEYGHSGQLKGFYQTSKDVCWLMRLPVSELLTYFFLPRVDDKKTLSGCPHSNHDIYHLFIYLLSIFIQVFHIKKCLYVDLWLTHKPNKKRITTGAVHCGHS